jgi:hypothetical protein
MPRAVGTAVLNRRRGVDCATTSSPRPPDSWRHHAPGPTGLRSSSAARGVAASVPWRGPARARAGRPGRRPGRRPASSRSANTVRYGGPEPVAWRPPPPGTRRPWRPQTMPGRRAGGRGGAARLHLGDVRRVDLPMRRTSPPRPRMSRCARAVWSSGSGRSAARTACTRRAAHRPRGRPARGRDQVDALAVAIGTSHASLLRMALDFDLIAAGSRVAVPLVYGSSACPTRT